MIAKGIDEGVVPTICCPHCGGTCLLKVHTKQGVITRIETDDGEEPQFRGCARGRAMRQKVYDPSRLKYPMKRVGERGEGRFERISWDEALDTVAGELKRVRDMYGPEAILSISSGGDVSYLNTMVTGPHFFAKLGGCTVPWGSPSYEGAYFGALATLGDFAHCANTRDDLLNSKLIVMWGWNPAVSVAGTNTGWYVAQAKEAGARIIAVDPRFTDSVAVFADQWVPILPGTDTAMLVAMAHVILRDGLQDKFFLDRFTVGFDSFVEYVMGQDDGQPKTPQWAEPITGVPAPTIEALAREYATTKPAALVPGMAPGRTAYGEQFHRASITLAAMTGNTGNHGGFPAVTPGGFSAPVHAYRFTIRPPRGGANPADGKPPLRRVVLHGDRTTPRSDWPHGSLAADALLRGKSGGYPADYKLVYLFNANFVNQYPNSSKIAQALMKPEFVVAHEVYLNATARYADILLPASVSMERNDIIAGGATPMYGYMNKVVDPPGEAKSHWQIFNELATRVGIASLFDKTEEEMLQQMVKESPEIEDFEALKRQASVKVKQAEPHVAFRRQIEDPENNPFRTPSGKIEIYSQQIADANDPLCPPIPTYIEPWEGSRDPLIERYPLRLITTHERRRAHSQLERVPWLLELSEHAIFINSADARARGIKDGDKVKVFNDRGQMVVLARVTERIMPTVVDLGQGAWYAPDSEGVDLGGCANTLTKDAPSPGGAYPYNTCVVDVVKV